MKTLFLFLIIGVSINTYSQEPYKIVKHKKEASSVLFQCANDQAIKISMITDDIFRVQIAKNGEFEKSMMIEWGFVKDDFPKVSFDITKKKDHYLISTSSLSILIARDNFGLEVLDKSGNMIIRNNDKLGYQTENGNVLNFDMPADEHFFGFGFMRKSLDARGQKLTFKRGYRWNEATVPYFISTRGYAFYSNSVYNHDFDFTSKSDTPSGDYYSITTGGGQIDFYLIYGPDFPKLIDRYTDLTGKSLMVPRWAFGLEYRVRYFADQEELLDIARTFREKEIPCDIMALCPGWEEESYSMIWEWSPTRYPQPKKMVDELWKMGYKLEAWESGVAPKENLSDPKVRKQWYDIRRNIVDDGVQMFMQDDPYPRSIISTELLTPVLSGKDFSDTLMNSEQLNNISNTLYTETLFNEYRKQTNKRAMVMFHAYSATVASHRWPFQWAGDYQAANGLLNAGLSGHAMVSHDIRNPYAAGWHEGFFTPFSVINSWAYYREPWLYSESIEETHRLYACLRSRLSPYYYSSLWQSHTTGLPIQRPMVLNYHEDPETHQMRSQFMVGDWFLLALSDWDDAPGGEKVDFWTGSQKGNFGRAYLPKGRWIDYWSGEVKRIKKAKWVQGEWPESLGGLLYVKAGAIIPMGQVKNYTGETEDEVMVLDIYPHKRSSYQLYEDDGISYSYEEGEFALTNIICEEQENNTKVSISERAGTYEGMPKKRTFLLKIHSLTKPKSISVDGEALKFFNVPAQLIHNSEQKGWYYDEVSKKAIIKIDKGWKYQDNEKGKDPLATIPLTAKNERIEWDENGTGLKKEEREIIIQMPVLAITEFTSSMSALPADGFSQAKIGLLFKNQKETIRNLQLKIEGPASFVNGESALVMDPSTMESFSVIAGSTPGSATITVSGEKLETGTFIIPVYGIPVRVETTKSKGTLVADNYSRLQLSSELFDQEGSKVLNAASPIIVNIEGEGLCENGLISDSVFVVNGTATFAIRSTLIPGQIKVSTSFNQLVGEVIEIGSEKGDMQVRINPPEKIHLNSDGGWIPDQVDVFVNFKAGGKWTRNGSNKVILNVYNKQNELLDTYKTSAKSGEAIFKDISYYKRPAQCLFEIKCEGYETITRKVFENTWEVDPDKTKGP